MNGERRDRVPARVVKLGRTTHGHGVHAHGGDLATPLAHRSSVPGRSHRAPRARKVIPRQNSTSSPPPPRYAERRERKT